MLLTNLFPRLALRCALLAVVVGLSHLARAEEPAWWSEEPTRIWETSAVNTDNYAPINVGQLKHVAAQARLYLNARIHGTGGAGPVVDALIQSFTTTGNDGPANVGQLKHVAKAFYDRLRQIPFDWQRPGTSGVLPTQSYPWTGTTNAEDAAPANVGQLKNMFHFAIGDDFLVNNDFDSMWDGWEIAYFGSIARDGEADMDGDGLMDYEEFGLGTNPISTDTDGDGAQDADEVNLYLSNPAVADIDTDGDGLLDAVETWLFLDPALADSDGNGIADGLEDADLDLLTNLAEFAVQFTRPHRHDTDLDTLNDGWEVAHGFNPRVSNLNDGNPANDPNANPDNDGLTNSQEEAIGTNPNNADTDGDGVDDKVERDQGSNPSDANSFVAPATGTVPVAVTFGDPSGSHSEKYRVKLTPLEGDTAGVRYRTNRDYGELQTDTLMLPRGGKYQVELLHIDTNLSGYPDFDYNLAIDTSQANLVVHDPEGILGTSEDPGAGWYSVAKGKSATLHVPLFEWVTPKESPVTGPDNSGDGCNEFTYNSASPGVLTIDLKVLVSPTGTAGLIGHDGVRFSDRCIFALPGITGSTFAWNTPANSNGKSQASGDHLMAISTYTTLPTTYAAFGLKKAEFKCDGHAGTLPDADFEVFYLALQYNHPGGNSADPNWFHYYKQNEGGSDYSYDPLIPRSTSVSGTPGSIRIADNAYSGGQYITTAINNNNGLLGATGASATFKYYKYFYGAVLHERQHTNHESSVGDTDGDDLPDTFELTVSHTDPVFPYSAYIVGGSVVHKRDDEVYAGGPIEEAAIHAADTSHDWANPGTNSKP